MQKLCIGAFMVLTFAAFSAAQQNDTQQLLHRAADAVDISSAGGSYLLTGNIEFNHPTKDVPARGMWAMAVGANRREQLDLSFPGLQWNIWIDHEVQSETGEYLQPEIRGAQTMFRFEELLRADYTSARVKQSKLPIGGVITECADWNYHDHSALKVCVDPQSGWPLRIDFRGSSFEFSDFNKVGDRVFPFKLRLLEDGKEVARAQVDKVSPLANPVTFLTPPPTAIRTAGLECNGVADGFMHLKKNPAPEYPMLARETRIQGNVRFLVKINETGGVQVMKLISGHPMLVPAAQDAIQHWQYQPFVCNGIPVDVYSQITISFSLGPL